jgi:hypothetical protein
MEATCSCEISVDFQWTTRRYIPEDSTLHNHRYENLKSYNILIIIQRFLRFFVKYFFLFSLLIYWKGK